MVVVLELAFHTKDPNRMVDTIKIFLFPDLSQASGSEGALLAQSWDAVIGGNTIMTFSDTGYLI